MLGLVLTGCNFSFNPDSDVSELSDDAEDRSERLDAGDGEALDAAALDAAVAQDPLDAGLPVPGNLVQLLPFGPSDGGPCDGGCGIYSLLVYADALGPPQLLTCNPCADAGPSDAASTTPDR